MNKGLALYIINDNPSYIAMLANSVKMLRKYSNIECRVIFVENNSGLRLNPDGANMTAHILDSISEKSLPVRTKDHLFDHCENLGVDIWSRQLPTIDEDPNYAPVHRMLIEECKEENVLFLDADTFIFDNVSDLFDIYQGYDFAATPNLCGFQGNFLPNYENVPEVMIGDIKIKPYNSGVIVWNNGWCHQWAATIYDYCRSIKQGTHPLSEWIIKTNSIGGREELACNLFVLDYKLNSTFLDMHHCCVREMSKGVKPYIFHSTCNRYCYYFNQINSTYNRKFRLKV